MVKITRQFDPIFDFADVRGLARLISEVENRDRAALAAMERVYEARKGGYYLGVTGPPGAGKSTLVDQLIRKFRAGGQRVGVLAIDPSSPFSGGAVLGDRVRMQAHASDPGVYIRSIGSRGAHGGLSRAARDIVRIYDAYGFDWIIVETVGVGQTELAIMEIADTTLVVLVPEAGDTIQTLKAGLLEIADIFLVNKADRDGVDQIFQALAAMVMMGRSGEAAAHEEHDMHHRMRASRDRRPETGDQKPVGWQIPVLKTVATKGEGMAELCAAIARHRKWERSDPAHMAHRRQLQEAEFLDLCAEVFRERLEIAMASDTALKKFRAEVGKGEVNPYAAVTTILRQLRF